MPSKYGFITSEEKKEKAQMEAKRLNEQKEKTNLICYEIADRIDLKIQDIVNDYLSSQDMYKDIHFCKLNRCTWGFSATYAYSGAGYQEGNKIDFYLGVRFHTRYGDFNLLTTFYSNSEPDLIKALQAEIIEGERAKTKLKLAVQTPPYMLGYPKWSDTDLCY